MARAGQVEYDPDRLRDVCVAWNVRELCLFGSALGGVLGEDSDIDLLVTFEPGTEWRLRDIMDLEDDLAAIFGREVDLVERASVGKSPNYIRRRAILGSLATVYAAR